MIGRKMRFAGVRFTFFGFAAFAAARASGRPAEIPASGPAVQLTIAAPAELNPAITRLARAFEQKSKRPVQVTVVAWLDPHSPPRRTPNFDAVFSSDRPQLQRLAASGTISSSQAVARDPLVICVSPLVRAYFPPRNPLVGLKEKVVSRIVIPDGHTVYGAAANQALKSIKVYKHQLAEKLEVGKDLSDIADLMERGDVSAALLPQSALETYSLRGARVIPIPQNLYPQIRMEAALARRSKHPREAAEFLRFAASDDGKAIFRQSGFLEPRRPSQKHESLPLTQSLPYNVGPQTSR